jgi:hypothetical protein
MKDPNYPGNWTDTLPLHGPPRRKDPPSTVQTLPPQALDLESRVKQRLQIIDDFIEAEAEYCKLVRACKDTLRALRAPRQPGKLVLLTPAIVPTGKAATYEDEPTLDPFEVFGRALSKYRKPIRHVPYVPRDGFTELHRSYLDHADAVVIVVCEPYTDGEQKRESIDLQHDFALEALAAFESRETNASRALVLVQCGCTKFRPPADPSFRTVVESVTFNDEVARRIAHAMFKTEI